jgi:hypothetical protein
VSSGLRSRALAILLIIAGVGATLGGLYGQIFLTDDEGHHDGREFSFALDAGIGTDELVVTPAGDNEVVAEVLRAGQAIGLGEVHDGLAHYFVVARDLTSYEHVVASDPGPATLVAPAGDVRVIAQVSPSSGNDFVELGADVAVDGAPGAEQNITDDDEWTNGELTVRRDFLDFVLSQPWNGDPLYEGPALLTLFRADDLSFVHAHAEVVDPTRFSFATNLPGLGDYLAALEFEQDGEIVTALFRFTF